MPRRMGPATGQAEGARVFPGSVTHLHPQQSNAALLSWPQDRNVARQASRRQRAWIPALSLFIGDLLAFAAAGALGGGVAYFVASHVVGTENLAFQ